MLKIPASHENASGKLDISVSDIAIDWFSFSLLLPVHLEEQKELFEFLGKLLMPAFSPSVYEKYFVTAHWETFAPRDRYKHAIRNVEHGILILYGGQNHASIELQGKCCALMANDNALKPLIEYFKERCSRIDIAVDFVGCSVMDMANSMQNERFKSAAYMREASGETAYIGNRKSARFVRVYEYNEPNPRAGIPRIEFVSRKKHAKIVAAMVNSHTVPEIAEMLNNVYKFENLPNMAETEERMPAPKIEKSNSKKISWLLKQVKPSVLSLMHENEIDAEFIITNFIPEEERRAFVKRMIELDAENGGGK